MLHVLNKSENSYDQSNTIKAVTWYRKSIGLLNLRKVVMESKGSGGRFICSAFFLPSKRKSSFELPQGHHLDKLIC